MPYEHPEITLYRDTHLLAEKNIIIESLEDYLFDKVYMTKTIQYIKNALSLTIKLDIDQSALDNIINLFDYCKIANNEDASPFYYFITNRVWKSSSCIELSLVMDTLNTYQNKYGLSAETQILREHRDRFKKHREFTQSAITSLETGKEYNLSATEGGAFSVICGNNSAINVKVYNFYNAEINAFKCGRISLNDSALYFQSASGLETYYQFSKLEQAEYKFSISFNDLPALGGGSILPYLVGYYTYPAGYYDRVISKTNEGLSPKLYGIDKGVIDPNNENYYMIYKAHSNYDPEKPDDFIYNNAIDTFLVADSKLKVNLQNKSVIRASDLAPNTRYYLATRLYFDPKQGYDVFGYIDNEKKKLAWVEEIALMQRHGVLYFYTTDNVKIKYAHYKYSIFGILQDEPKFSGETSSPIVFDMPVTYIRDDAGGSTNYPTTFFKDIFKDATSIDAPQEESTPAELLSFNEIDRSDTKLIKIIKLPYAPVNNLDNFVYDSGSFMYKLPLNDKGYINTLSVEVLFNPYSDLVVNIPNFGENIKRQSIYESKLYHSDYYIPKFVYDSFAFPFLLETLISPETTNFSEFRFEFIASNTTNSRFMFRFPDYVSKYKSADYDNILMISRNNEIPIFNNYYLNYLRNGYNYDVKAKNRTELTSVLGFTGSAIATIGGLASENPYLIASGITGLVSSGAGLINGIKQQEDNLSQKLESLKMQSASASGSDDVDIMSALTDNKAKLMLYKVGEETRSALWSLFYLKGYTAGYSGRPNTDSRLNFNYIQCIPAYRYTNDIPKDRLDDISARYNSGVTIFHKVNNAWDIYQQYENWETSLLN